MSLFTLIMHFIKLKNQFIFDTESLITDKSNLFVSYGNVNYYDVTISEKIKSTMYSVIPIEFHKFFTVFYLTGEGTLSPHDDLPSRCSILFYNNPGNFRAEFYELINVNAEPMNTFASNINTSVRKLTEKEYSPPSWRVEDLKLIDSYIAQPNEAWCINGETIHAVSSLNSSSIQTRSALVLNTEILSFDDVVNLLKQTNSIECF